MTYAIRIKKLEERVKILEAVLSNGEAERLEYRSLLKQISTLQRFERSEELGPAKNHGYEARTRSG